MKRPLHSVLASLYPAGTMATNVPFQYGAYDPPPRNDSVFGKSWWVDAPWAHPVWSSYAVMLYDLTSQSGDGIQPTIHAQGVTHEVVVMALDPQDAGYREWTSEKAPSLLQPPNHIYQFYAKNDTAAAQRIETLVQNIAQGKVNPDTDARQQWELMFADGVIAADQSETTLTRH